MGYLTGYMLTITIGMFQFGYCIGGFNALMNISLYRFGFLEDPANFYQ